MFKKISRKALHINYDHFGFIRFATRQIIADHAILGLAYGVVYERIYSLELRVGCKMWEHRQGMKEAEGCCIKRATQSDYIHNRDE
jgi:hypothetical protein